MNPSLDAWIASELGLHNTCRAAIRDYESAQMDLLAETAERARSSSPFYARILPVDVGRILTVDQGLTALPLISSGDLIRWGEEMLCVSQDAVARVVSMPTSGSTGPPKRLYFSDADLGRTMDFFSHGMSSMAGHGDSVLILLPGRRADGVADLLARALLQIGARPIFPADLDRKSAARALDRGVRTVVGPPVPVLQLAESRPGAAVRDVLLCWDRVPTSLLRRVESAWGCRVLMHYGTVETGLGGAVECSPGSGMHVRMPDLMVEVLDPEDQRPVPHGTWGEIVISTPRREAMPLFRYRTGDMGRILHGSCGCANPVPRLDRVRGRLSDVRPPHPCPGLDFLDEILFSLPQIIDFQARLTREGTRPMLRLVLKLAREGRERRIDAVQDVVRGVLENIDMGVDVVFDDLKSLSWQGRKRIFSHG